MKIYRKNETPAKDPKVSATHTLKFSPVSPSSVLVNPHFLRSQIRQPQLAAAELCS